MNEEAANESRMWKFNCLVSCDDTDEIAREEVNNGILVVRHDKVWVVPRNKENQPIPPGEALDLKGVELQKELGPLHAFAGFYIQYPDEDRYPPERGLVSTISDDPPMLNWIYCDRATYELRYSNRTGSMHITLATGTGPKTRHISCSMAGRVLWPSTSGDGADSDPSTLWGKEGLRWAVYFDRDDNGLEGRRKGRDMFEIGLKRRIQSEEEQLKQNEAAEKKMQVKSRGGLSTQFRAPTKERTKNGRKVR